MSDQELIEQKEFGRPTKYEPQACKVVISEMRNGASIVEVCATLGICKQTFYNWTQEHPDFLDAYKKGLELSQAWWEKLGRAGAAGQIPIQPATWVFNMKNRFGWKDRVQQEHTGGFIMHFDKQDEDL